MDRKLVLTAQLAIARGHRVEVTEQLPDEGGELAVLAIHDLDTGVTYRRAEEPHGDLERWFGRVLECTVVIDGRGSHTVLMVDPEERGASGAGSALRDADAAAGAAKAEADRWGGADRVPAPPTDRVW